MRCLGQRTSAQYEIAGRWISRINTWDPYKRKSPRGKPAYVCMYIYLYVCMYIYIDIDIYIYAMFSGRDGESCSEDINCGRAQICVQNKCACPLNKTVITFEFAGRIDDAECYPSDRKFFAKVIITDDVTIILCFLLCRLLLDGDTCLFLELYSLVLKWLSDHTLPSCSTQFCSKF